MEGKHKIGHDLEHRLETYVSYTVFLRPIFGYECSVEVSLRIYCSPVYHSTIPGIPNCFLCYLLYFPTLVSH
jgi:hypothetical protein